MLRSIFHPGNFALDSVLLAFSVALLLGLGIGLLYRRNAVSHGFAAVLALMPLLVTAVILIVNGNLGASVAVLGAFGLVRFRSAPGTAKEIGFLFFAMAVGLAVGMGFLSLAVLLTVIVAAAYLLLEKSGFGTVECKSRQLRITIPEDLDYDGIFDDLFRQYTRYATLERVKTTNMGTMYELSYLIEMRDMSQQKALIDGLRCRNGNLTISMGLVKREKNEL